MTEETNTTTVKTIHVLVTRGVDKIPTEIPEYELEILKAAHLEENVEVLEDEEPGEIEVVNDAGGEYERMKLKYNRKGARIVEQVYPTPDSFGRAAGLGKAKQTNAARKSAEASQATVITAKANKEAAKATDKAKAEVKK